MLDILNKIKGGKSSDSESEKNRPTKPSDIKNLTRQYNFTKEEITLLSDICKTTECPNIYYSIRSTEIIDDTFKKYYETLQAQNATPEHFHEFYKLRFKLANVVAQKAKIGSTVSLPENSSINFIDDDGELHPFKIVHNSKSNFALEISEAFFKSPRKPEELKKAKFMFKHENGITYLFICRPLRYEEKSGRYYMILSHSTNLITEAQRQFQREFVDEECQFSSSLKDSKKFPAELTNVSAGGCCIHCELPIKEKQEIFVYYPKLGLDEATTGIIKHTRIVPAKNKYALHIQFTNISMEVQNRIYSYVYKFEL